MVMVKVPSSRYRSATEVAHLVTTFLLFTINGGGIGIAAKFQRWTNVEYVLRKVDVEDG